MTFYVPEEYWDSYKQYLDELNESEDFDVKTNRLLSARFNEHIHSLAEVAARRELRRELEDKLLFYPLGKKDVLRLFLAYTLTVIGVSIYLTIFVLTQMGKIS